MKKRFNHIFVIILLVFSAKQNVFSQNSVSWTHQWEASKSFIENNGQFKLQSGEKVLFAYDGGSTMIYFTNEGLIF